MEPLENPERAWRPPNRVEDVSIDEIEERVGPVDADFEVLGGGHANANIRLADGRVLRLYRRDADAARKEKALLERSWQRLRVPQVAGSGSDFLVLEYVDHAPLQGRAEHGAAIGRALAEIHAQAFDCAGFLGSAADGVAKPFTDVVADFREYMASREQVDPEVRDAVVDFWSARRDDLDALAEHAVLLHGDFKVSNLHWTDTGLPLVLDWEFAYAGPALADIGQLIRWQPPATFCDAFAEAYREFGGELPDDWRDWAEVFDLVNLVGLLEGARAGSRRHQDVTQRLTETLGRG
ncbi:MAG: phosphotransferase family protein [Myxococcota bacterium]